MHGAVAVIVVGEMEPLLVFADETVGVVHRPPRAVAGIFDEHALIRPGLHAVETDPQRQRMTSFRVRVVQEGDSITAEGIERGLRAGVWKVGLHGEFRPRFAAVLRLRVVEHSAKTVSADNHGNATIAQFRDVVLGPAVVAVVGREADVAVLGPGLAAITADEHAVARIADVVEQRLVPRLFLRRRRRRAGGRTFVMLERQQDAAIARDDVIPDEREFRQASGDRLGRRP